MNRRKKKMEPRYILLIVIIIIVILIAVLSYALKTDKKLNTFESIVKDTVVGIQKVVYMPFRNFSSMISDYRSLKDVLEENKILKANVEKIESIESENAELKKEIEELKSELNI